MSGVPEFILRSSIVLALGLVACWGLRKQPAALRHWMLAAAIALAVAQPLMTRLLPQVQLPIVATLQAEAVSSAVADGSVVLDRWMRTDARPAGTDWRSIALLVWAGGAAISLGVLLFGASWLTWLGARAMDAGSNWQEAADTLRSELQIDGRVRIAITTHPAMLVTWGTMVPVILLPANAGSWPEDRVRLVLAHEMAHLARRDWLIQLLAEMARAINWFNPLFWIACARLRRESEYACDDIVLDLGIGGTSYASHLVDLARSFSVHGRTWLPAPSIARPSTLERRVRAMLNPQVNRLPVSRLRRAAVAVMVLAIALPIAAAQTGTPSGTVSDPMGRPLPDATIRLVSEPGGQVFETKSNVAGAFQLPDVPAGDYMLSVHTLGFSAKRHRMQLKGGAVTIALQVQVGTLSETVTIRGGKDVKINAPRVVEERAYTPSAPACSAAGGQIVPPMKIRDVRPNYRAEWVADRLTGNVLLQVTIGKDGVVRSVDNLVGGGNAELQDEAIAAVSQWRFSPTYLNCEPIDVQMFVTTSFGFEP